MLKTFIATTEEIDDPDDAVAEILEGIPAGELLENSVAYLACPIEWHTAGIVGRIQEELPFPVIGVSTLCTAADGVASSDMLTVTVITADDVSFKVSSFRAGKNLEELVSGAVKPLVEGGKPEIIMMFGAFCQDSNGDDILKYMDNLTGGVPVYATLASDTSDTSDNMTHAPVFFEGEKLQDTFVVIGFYGNVAASYHSVSIREKSLTNNFDFVTKSEKNVIYEINNKPALQFLRESGSPPRMGQVFVFSDTEGIWVARAGFAIDDSEPITTPVVVTGDIAAGSRVRFGIVDKEEVLESCTELLEDVRSFLDNAKFVFVNSCIARYMAANFKSVEYDKIAEVLGGREYFVISSGGEYCPVKVADGKLVNRFHNVTLTLCVLVQPNG